MHVTAQREKVVVAINQFCFEASIKEMPMALMSQIVVNSICGGEGMHEFTELASVSSIMSQIVKTVKHGFGLSVPSICCRFKHSYLFTHSIDACLNKRSLHLFERAAKRGNSICDYISVNRVLLMISGFNFDEKYS